MRKVISLKNFFMSIIETIEAKLKYKLHIFFKFLQFQNLQNICLITTDHQFIPIAQHSPSKILILVRNQLFNLLSHLARFVV